MNISELSIRRPVFAWMLMLFLIFFGLLAFWKLGINEYPDVDFPNISISYTYEGATPEVVEKDVLEPVESVLVTLPGIKSMTSRASRSSGSINLEFEIDENIDLALQEVNTLLGRAQRLIPDAVDTPTLRKSNASDSPIMYMAITTDNTMSVRDLMLLFRDEVRDLLTTIEGVSEVRAFGYHEPMMRIDFDLKKLSEKDLTPMDLANAVKSSHLELPGGLFEAGEEERSIRLLGEGKTVEDFQEMIISKRGGQINYAPLRLKDVATVYDGVENIRRLSRVNGKVSLGMAMLKQRGVNAMDVAKRVKKKLHDINEKLKGRAEIIVNYDATVFIQESVRELVMNLIFSCLLTSLICYLFLKSPSATFNIMLAIPTSILGTFIFMYYLGFTLNSFSLLGLTLAVGIVVDDAIVMLENIVRYADKGFNRVKASLLGSKEISFAIIATTISLVAIFIPITLMKGIEGKFFYEFALTLCLAVMLSSLEALTLAPMRCSQFLETTKSGGNFIHRGVDRVMIFLQNKYKSLLSFSLYHQKSVLLFSFFLIALSLFSFKFLKKEFSPKVDRGTISTLFMAPDGKSLEYTQKKVEEFEKIVATVPEIERNFVSVGGFGRGSSGNKGNGILILKPFHQRERSTAEVLEDVQKKVSSIDGIKIILKDRSGGGVGSKRGSDVEFTLFGGEMLKLKEFYEEIKEKLETEKLVTGIRSDDETYLPEYHLTPNRSEIIRRQFDLRSVLDNLNYAGAGVTLGQYTNNGNRFDVFMQMSDSYRGNMKDFLDLKVRNNRGETNPLIDLVQVSEEVGPQNIYRENRHKGFRVDGNLPQGITLGEVTDRVLNWAEKSLPEGYRLEFGEDLNDSLLSTVYIMLLGILFAYMVLASQFNSFVDPLIIFYTIPFGLFGSFMAILLTSQSLNIYSIIGLLLSMGLVTKSGILLVEFANQLRDGGMKAIDAIKEAALVRFRPIIMTTLSTLAAAIPSLLSTGVGYETRFPLAVVVIGGVSFATLVSLVVVPCLYLLWERKRFNLDLQ